MRGIATAPTVVSVTARIATGSNVRRYAPLARPTLTCAEYVPTGYAADGSTTARAPGSSVPRTRRSIPAPATATSYASPIGVAASSAMVPTDAPFGLNVAGSHAHESGASVANESAVYEAVTTLPVRATRNARGAHVDAASPRTCTVRTPPVAEYTAPSVVYGTTGPPTTEISASVAAPVVVPQLGAGTRPMRARVGVEPSTKLNPLVAVGSMSVADNGAATHATVLTMLDVPAPIAIAMVNTASPLDGAVNEVSVTTMADPDALTVNGTVAAVAPRPTAVTTSASFVVEIVNVTTGPT